MIEQPPFSSAAVQRVDQHVARKPHLQEMIGIEPAVLTLLKLAASRSSRAERWHTYETLKRVGSQYVGWNARNPHMSDSRYYDAYIEAIDLLLVPPQIEGENAEDALLFHTMDQLRDAVLRFFPQAALPNFFREESPEIGGFRDIREIIDEIIEELEAAK